MIRAIVGVVLGYLTMAVLIFATFSLAYLAMGADGAFRPDSYDVTAFWLVVSFLLATAAAVTGGWVCALMARGPRAPMVLAGLVLLLGLIEAGVVATSPRVSKPRTADVGNMEAMMSAQQPVWVALANPLLGAAGVMLGSRLKGASTQRPVAALV